MKEQIEELKKKEDRLEKQMAEVMVSFYFNKISSPTKNLQ